MHYKLNNELSYYCLYVKFCFSKKEIEIKKIEMSIISRFPYSVIQYKYLCADYIAFIMHQHLCRRNLISDMHFRCSLQPHFS